MKKNIFIYLFVFTALILVFQLVNSNKILNRLEGKLSTISQFNKQLKDSIYNVQLQLDASTDFVLEGNEYALRYFEPLPMENIQGRVMDALYETNLLKEKNMLIPYAVMDRTFLINKVKVLNHRWIIADFSDGTHWGELFLTYEINKSGGVSFELKEHFIYPNPD